MSNEALSASPTTPGAPTATAPVPHPYLLSDAAVAAIVGAIQRPTMDPEIPRSLLRKLAAPFPVGKLRWRPGNVKGEGQGNARALAYIDARDVEKRLDDVLFMHWSSSYRELRGGRILVCRIEIRLPDGSVVARENGADDSDIEPDKGALSGAMVRAGKSVGVGRYIYGMPSPKVRLNGKSIAEDQMPILRAEEKKVWDKWVKSEDERKAKGRPTVAVPASLPTPTVAAPEPAAAPVPPASAVQPQPPTPADAFRTWTERFDASGDVDEMKKHLSSALKDPAMGASRDLLKGAYTNAMQRFHPGWTWEAAEAAAKAAQGGQATRPAAPTTKTGGGQGGKTA